MYHAIEAIRNRYSFTTQPYFSALRDGTLVKDDFAETQMQFLSAVVFFSRPMTVLAGRISRPELRIKLLRNVMDEHGERDLNQSHEATFLLFLKRLGVSQESLGLCHVGPEVKAFNLALWGVCSWDDIWIGAASLGMIEDIFARISAFIGDQVVAHGWLEPDELVHYKTHASLDIEHANDIFGLLEDAYRESPEQAARIEDGLALGAHLFLQLYQGLYEARHERRIRSVAGPTSLADGWVLPQDIPA